MSVTLVRQKFYVGWFYGKDRFFAGSDQVLVTYLYLSHFSDFNDSSNQQCLYFSLLYFFFIFSFLFLMEHLFYPCAQDLS